MPNISRTEALGCLVGSTIAAAIPDQALSQTLTPLRVGGGIDDGLTPLLYAMRAGLFKKAGLDIQLTSSQSGTALAAAVAGGGIDIAKSSLMSLISAYSRGVRFKLVAGAAQYLTSAPTDLLCVMKNSPLKTLADASGKIVAVTTLKGNDMMGTCALIDKSGGDSASLKFVEMPFPAMFPALEGGRADIASISVPTLANVLASGKVRTFGDPYSGIASRILTAGWFASADYVRQNMSIVQRFGSVMHDANAYCNAHHAETVPILAAYSHIDPQIIATMNRLTNAPDIDVQDIQPLIDTAAKYKYIDAAFAAKELLI
jgi:NitT/TauT family transport system substrate-binding protein